MEFEITANTPIAAITVGQLEGIIKRIVSDKPQISEPAPKAKMKNLSYQEASDFLNQQGCRISVSTLHQHVHKRSIPFRKFGKYVHFDASELLEWAESNMTKKLNTFK